MQNKCHTLRNGKMAKLLRRFNLWVGFISGCVAMLALQATLLQPFPKPLALSISTGSEYHWDQGYQKTSVCQGLKGNARVLLLDVHLEGNLGDEMETTPLLQELKRCDVHVTGLMSQWMKGRENQLGHWSVREHALIDIIEPPGTYERFSPSDYDAIVLAPGPWRLCEIRKYWPFRVDILMGGSILYDSDCSVSEILDAWEPSLITVREPYSYAILSEHPRWKNVLFMSGDLTHSFEPASASVQFWRQFYANGRRRTLLFVRSSNADQVISLDRQKLKVLTLMEGWKTLPAHEITFATSSSLEDADWLREWRSQHPIFQDDQFVQCETVEQLFGLIAESKALYTDRYHPGVVAHRFNKTITILKYEAEQGKLVGLYELISKQQNPEFFRTHTNRIAFERLWDTIRQLQSKEKRGSVRGDSGDKVPAPIDHMDKKGDGSSELPLGVVVGLPKSGTTSVYEFFSCSGYRTSHYCCCGSTQSEYPCAGGKQFSEQLQDNIKFGRPFWEGTGNLFVHAQLDGEAMPGSYFLPQHYLLQQIDQAAPEAIWILPLRPAKAWKKSVQGWLDMESRFQAMWNHHNSSASDGSAFELETFYHAHTERVRQYCKEHRSPSLCVEIDIEDEHAGDLLKKHFPNAVSSCWGRHNAGPFFQVLP